MPIRVYSHLLDPREHPDDPRRAVRPPSWATFGGRTQFTCLRSFEVKDGLITGYVEEIEKYTRTHQLGTILWPSYPILFAKNLGDLADEIKRRGLFLFDIWGYVPGSGPGGYWLQFKVPPAQLELLESKLGERWLGTDVGEQDGRYINGYAGQMAPASASRLEQYFNFQRHFERMGDDLGHKHATLVSLNFGHYLLKEGTYTFIGAETAQALPNSQVYYAFIRGAGKQYGVPWFGNASVWNRWSFKSYTTPGRTEGVDFGPTKGTSLSLLKRLLYTHVLYNGMFVGFEANWIENDQLTPIGVIQQAAQCWVNEHGQPGVMHTPVALLVDFHAGWSFPRHLYTDRVYRVWGNLPYEPGDYLTHAILDLLYPGYQDSSYFHDESGFNAPTPYGDMADCLLSDVQGWLLQRYPVVVVAGELAGGIEIRAKLEAYAREGGHLVLTAGNLAKFPGGIAGIRSVRQTKSVVVGQGRITVFASAFGLRPAGTATPVKNEIDQPLAQPFVLEEEVRTRLGEIFDGQALFAVEGKGLSVVTCRKGAGEFTVGIANNSWRESRFRLISRCGAIQSVRELVIDGAERAAVGYLPEGVDGSHLGRNGTDTIAGGDIRIFAVTVGEQGVVEIPHCRPAPRPAGRWLTLRETRSIKESILARPTFFEHFDGVVVDWRYLHDREGKTLADEARWIARQKLRVTVDLSSGLDSYPTIRLLDNGLEDYGQGMAIVEDVLAKMTAVGARDLIVSLHRAPENNFTPEQAATAWEEALRKMARQAAARGITVHLRVAFDKATQRLPDLVGMLDRVAQPNLKLAPATSVLLAAPEQAAELGRLAPGRVGLWLYAAVRRDIAGYPCDFHAPLHLAPEVERKQVSAWRQTAPDVPVVFDALGGGVDGEYLEARTLAELAG
jgi:sugar phosphate isomerase/epimerase